MVQVQFCGHDGKTSSVYAFMTKNNGYGFPAASQVREELFTIGLLMVNDLVQAYIQESSGEQGQALSN